jgi:hypothetical protein
LRLKALLYISFIFPVLQSDIFTYKSLGTEKREVIFFFVSILQRIIVSVRFGASLVSQPLPIKSMFIFPFSFPSGDIFVIFDVMKSKKLKFTCFDISRRKRPITKTIITDNPEVRNGISF